jgi:8-oxo-dGTP pyrophosphatase MutT (NUDIX family)
MSLIFARRVGYRIAHRILRVWWFLRRPHVSGVKCVLTCGERLLLVRHTYGDRRWDLPGGRIKRGETPAEAARREIREELDVQPQSWRSLGEFDVHVDYRRDRLHLFGGELAGQTFSPDLGELAAVTWAPRDSLPEDLTQLVRALLTHVLPR